MNREASCEEPYQPVNPAYSDTFFDGIDDSADEQLGTLQLMIESGEISPEEAASMFQIGDLTD